MTEEKQLEGTILSPEEEVQHALQVIEKYKKNKQPALADSYHFDSSNHPQPDINKDITIRPSYPVGTHAPNSELIDKIQNILSEPENVEAIVQGGGSGLIYRLLAAAGVSGGLAGAISGALSGFAAEKLVDSKRKRRRKTYQQEYYQRHIVPNDQQPQQQYGNNQQQGNRDSFDV